MLQGYCKGVIPHEYTHVENIWVCSLLQHTFCGNKSYFQVTGCNMHSLQPSLPQLLTAVSVVLGVAVRAGYIAVKQFALFVLGCAGGACSLQHYTMCVADLLHVGSCFVCLCLNAQLSGSCLPFPHAVNCFVKALVSRPCILLL